MRVNRGQVVSWIVAFVGLGAVFGYFATSITDILGGDSGAQQILAAGGDREAAILRAQGDREAQVLRAQADRQAQMLRAEGEAQAVSTVFGNLALAYGKEVGLQASLTLWLVVAANVGALATQPLFGMLADRIGRKPVFVYGAVSSAVFMPFYMLSMSSGNTAVTFALAILTFSCGYAAANAVWPSFYGEMFSTTVAPRPRASRAAALTASSDTSRHSVSTDEESAVAKKSAAAFTSSALSRPLAPGLTMMQFSPASSTRTRSPPPSASSPRRRCSRRPTGGSSSTT